MTFFILILNGVFHIKFLMLSWLLLAANYRKKISVFTRFYTQSKKRKVLHRGWCLRHSTCIHSHWNTKYTHITNFKYANANRQHCVITSRCNIIQIWTAVECKGVIYCTVVTSYCPRPKLLLKPSYFPRAFRPSGKYEGWRSNFRSRAILCYHSAINSTSAWNKQSIFGLLSHHQKCTLTGEITGFYFSRVVDKNNKNTSQFQLVAGSPIHLSAYLSLWRIQGPLHLLSPDAMMLQIHRSDTPSIDVTLLTSLLRLCDVTGHSHRATVGRRLVLSAQLLPSQPPPRRRGSSPKFLGGLAPGPLHVITNTMSVTKKRESLQKSGWPAINRGPGSSGPSVEPRLAPRLCHSIAPSIHPTAYAFQLFKRLAAWRTIDTSTATGTASDSGSGTYDSMHALALRVDMLTTRSKTVAWL